MKNLECIPRVPRMAILASLSIYACLLLVYYRRSVPLRIDRAVAAGVNDTPGQTMEKLLIELDQKEHDRNENEVDPEEEDNRDSRLLLEEVFVKADTDGDELLDIRELALWIHGRITEHIDRAMKDNIGLFTAIDNNPRNGENLDFLRLFLELRWHEILSKNWLDV